MADRRQWERAEALRAHLLAALVAQMERRREYAGLDWIEAEREALARAAREWAREHGGRQVDARDVERVEGLAVGHSDYAEKLVIYVAEEVLR